MNALGTLFYNELKDYSQASEWFRKAAERGCARALNNLGVCYELGQGVEVDFDQSFQLYKESMAKGYHPAEFNLAMLLVQKAR
jgi:TPR repeat protein